MERWLPRSILVLRGERLAVYGGFTRAHIGNIAAILHPIVRRLSRAHSKFHAMKPTILLLLTCSAFSLTTLGQEAPPPELLAQREAHLKELQRIRVPVLTNYLRTLESLKQQFAREARTSAAALVDAEIAKTRSELETATELTNKTSDASIQLTIISASFGQPNSKNEIDVTDTIRGAFNTGKKTIRLVKEVIADGKDPAPYKNKVIAIHYTTKGEKKRNEFPSNSTLNFEEHLR